jgi:hypothetical protein
MNWNLGGRYGLSRLSESETNRANARNQGNIGGHLSIVLTANAGFVVYEALRYIYTVVFFCFVETDLIV